MQFEPTSEQESFINHAVASGRFNAPEEALSDAVNLWLERERRRMEIIAALDAAEAEIAVGHYREYDRSELPLLLEELKAEGRAMLEAKQAK